MAIEGRSDAKMGGKVRLGMVGGGEGAFIGAVHRIASRIDDNYELVAGALSSTPDKARRSGGKALGLAADRIYDDYESMAKAEAKRPDGIRGGGDRHPEPHARRPDLRLPQGGRSCHLRQAADGVARRSEEDEGRGREIGPHFRADPQLHRISAGAPDARNGAGRGARRDPVGAGRISAGLADRANRKAGQ